MRQVRNIQKAECRLILGFVIEGYGLKFFIAIISAHAQT
jgi:hypothetical protein